MAWDKTKIVNLAIIKIGDDRISNVDTDEDSKAAEVMREIYDNVRDALLQSYPWNFATELSPNIAKSGTAPRWEFTNKYPLPADFLTLLAIKDEVTTVELLGTRAKTIYQVRKKFIHTDMGSPIQIRYTQRITDEGQFTPLFGESFAAKLALDSGESITQSNTKNVWLLNGFDRTIARAFAADAIENPPDPLPEDEWLNARF